MNRSLHTSRPGRRQPLFGGRCGLPVGVGVLAAFVLGIKADDASASALGGAASQFGLLTALLAFLVIRAWQTHQLFASVTTLGSLSALVIGAVLVWRCAVARQPRLTTPFSSRPVRGAAEEAAEKAQVQLPEGVDRRQLLAELRRTFMALQAAWDQSSPQILGEMTTPEMLAELCSARSAGYGKAQHSEVLTLDVQLIAFERVEASCLACVEFSGQIRETPASPSAPFREFWMLTRQAGGTSGWRLAKHQALL